MPTTEAAVELVMSMPEVPLLQTNATVHFPACHAIPAAIVLLNAMESTATCAWDVHQLMTGAELPNAYVTRPHMFARVLHRLLACPTKNTPYLTIHRSGENNDGTVLRNCMTSVQHDLEQHHSGSGTRSSIGHSCARCAVAVRRK